ncbi:hypothetical protein TARUN_4650 [Trichoderma arundinaceum]|uniref:Uncharacterized protein n=1 Tax=Trichoderma arundinaceum TaxID=490622 RepID=A0A395NNK2_TRIAR|nr:hypothetical protein TARUN_4650 [Trichoderma arundinaceum]
MGRATHPRQPSPSPMARTCCFHCEYGVRSNREFSESIAVGTGLDFAHRHHPRESSEPLAAAHRRLAAKVMGWSPMTDAAAKLALAPSPAELECQTRPVLSYPGLPNLSQVWAANRGPSDGGSGARLRTP